MLSVNRVLASVSCILCFTVTGKGNRGREGRRERGKRTVPHRNLSNSNVVHFSPLESLLFLSNHPRFHELSPLPDNLPISRTFITIILIYTTKSNRRIIRYRVHFIPKETILLNPSASVLIFQVQLLGLR